jgi:hypothetical protein
MKISGVFLTVFTILFTAPSLLLLPMWIRDCEIDFIGHPIPRITADAFFDIGIFLVLLGCIPVLLLAQSSLKAAWIVSILILAVVLAMGAGAAGMDAFRR